MKKTILILILSLFLTSSFSVPSYAMDLQRLEGTIISKSCCYSQILDNNGDLWEFEIKNGIIGQNVSFYTDYSMPLNEQIPLFQLFGYFKKP